MALISFTISLASPRSSFRACSTSYQHGRRRRFFATAGLFLPVHPVISHQDGAGSAIRHVRGSLSRLGIQGHLNGIVTPPSLSQFIVDIRVAEPLLVDSYRNVTLAPGSPFPFTNMRHDRAD